MRRALLVRLLIYVFAAAPCAAVAAASAAPSDPSAEPVFRVRADFAAPLNADRGWAGAAGDNVTVYADRPFRIRFEASAAGRGERFRLQYRRNGGAWATIEAHDFPYPQRELTLDYANAEAGGSPAGWYIAAGRDGSLLLAEEEGSSVLATRAGQEPLTAFYSPPWELDEFSFAAKYRLPEAGAFAFVFGYRDADNHWRVLLDAGRREISVSRAVGGEETVLATRPAAIAPGEWLETEVKFEAGMLEVDFGDGELEFTLPVGNEVPVSDLGIHLSPGNSAAFRGFVIEGEPSSPPVSIVAAPAYRHGEPADDLLAGAAGPYTAGAGVSLAEKAPVWNATEGHGEFEWPLVIRRFADGAVTNETGDLFEFRMVDGDGRPLGHGALPRLALEIPPGHLGGTFVETPGRIGPWQAGNGDLYFIMEPAESDNLFMIVKSTDGGRSWAEVDGANRPATGDLESVDARYADGTIHILHQVTEATLHHAFRTSDHPTQPDTWAVTDELATAVTARAQMASMALRSDGSMVFFHLGDTVGYAVRSPAGEWSEETLIDSGRGDCALAGPQAVLGADDVVHLAYYRMDGSIWYRRLLPDGTLTPALQLAAGAGRSEDDFGAVLPLVYLPRTDTVVVIYRLADGLLRERRAAAGGPFSPAAKVSDRPVVQHAVDSQQVGADAVADGDTVRVLFIGEADRGIYSTHDAGDGWQPATLQVGGIDAAWVRGSVYVRPDGVRVYGYVYDAGSQGGAGFNRFAEWVLD